MTIEAHDTTDVPQLLSTQDLFKALGLFDSLAPSKLMEAHKGTMGNPEVTFTPQSFQLACVGLHIQHALAMEVLVNGPAFTGEYQMRLTVPYRGPRISKNDCDELAQILQELGWPNATVFQPFYHEDRHHLIVEATRPKL